MDVSGAYRPLPEDDLTFAPPPLSAYSIAVLQNAPLLKAVHFGADNTGHNDSNDNNNTHNDNNTHNADTHNTPSANGSSHTYKHSLGNSHGHTSHGHTGSHGSGSHGGSHGGSHHGSGSQSHGNTHESGPSHGLSQNGNGTTGDNTSVTFNLSADDMDETPKSVTPGGSVFSRPPSSGYTTRRSRLARKFHALPKRVPDLPDNGLLSPPAQLDTPKKITSDSDFFKSLEKFKQTSPNLDLLKRALPEHHHKSPPARIAELAHRSPLAHFPVYADKPAAAPKRVSPARAPLHDVPMNSLNSIRSFGDFRKPKAPRLLEISFAKTPHPAVSVPAPSVAPPNNVPDGAKRKYIHINSNVYEKLELLGRGGSSKVYKVRAVPSKKVFAVKKVSFDQFDEACVRGFKGEIDLLNRLRNDNRVVRLVDHAVSDGSIYLLMECGDIDLAHVLQSKASTKAPLDLNFVRFHATEVLRCVGAVHNAGIVHSDLKPANFLFVRGILKIIDFGIANAVPDHTANIYRESQIGTPNYMAPEALLDVNHSLGFSSRKGTTWKVGRPSDIWSCGCIIYQMIYGRPPYGSFSGQHRIMAIMNPQVEIQYGSSGIGGVAVPKSAVELMKKCLERNPSDRWTVEECLRSDFLQPKAVSETFVRDLVYSAVNFGYNSKLREIGDDVYDKLVETVLRQIQDLNYA